MVGKEGTERFVRGILGLGIYLVSVRIVFDFRAAFYSSHFRSLVVPCGCEFVHGDIQDDEVVSDGGR